MKKILTLGLAIAMLLLTLTGCFGKDKEETPSEKDIKIALSVLDNEYKRDNGAKTTEDFTLFSQSKGGDYTFTVTWAVDNASISIVKDDATGTYKVDLPEKNETEVTYTLTATLTCGEIVKTLKYTRVLPVYGVELKLGVVTQPQVGVEYYLGMYQANLGKAYYFAGDLDSKNSFYLATTEDASQSVKVVLEAVDGVPGAYRMYTTRNGAKTYFVLTERSDKVTSGNITLSTECPASYLTFNSEYNTLVYTDTVNNNSFFLGSYNTFATIGASNTTYLADGNFPAVLLSTDSNVEFIPTLPEVPQLSANATAQEIVTALYTLAPGQRLNGEFTLAGVVKSVDEAYSTEYENVTVTITVAGKDIGAYRLKGTGADTLKVGDTVTIKGELTNYSGKFQFDTGSQIVSIVPGTGSGTGTGSGSGTGSGDNDPITGIPDNCPLVEGTGYVLSVRNANGALYFNGVMGTGNSSGRFMGSTNASDAVLVYFEKVATSGYKLYFMNGTTKTYIVMDDSSTGGAFTTNVADATVFLWNTDLNTFVVADPDNARAFGAQDTSTYANMSAYATSNTNGYNFGVFTLPA